MANISYINGIYIIGSTQLLDVSDWNTEWNYTDAYVQMDYHIGEISGARLRIPDAKETLIIETTQAVKDTDTDFMDETAQSFLVAIVKVLFQSEVARIINLSQLAGNQYPDFHLDSVQDWLVLCSPKANDIILRFLTLMAKSDINIYQSDIVIDWKAELAQIDGSDMLSSWELVKK